MPTRWVDAADGTRLKVESWGSGERDLLVVPGLAEHAGRYAHVAAALAPRGWTVHVLELRGHGHSGGKRGHVERWADYVGDVKAASAALRPGWAMVGHSMGGLVSLSSVLDGVAPRKLALSNPLLGVAVQAPRLKIAAARVLSRAWPSLSLGNELSSAWLSRDAAVGQAYDADPLVYKTITPRWYTEMMAAQTRANAARWSLPLAMFVGDADPITSVAANRSFAERNGAALKLYPGMLHEIFNEIGKEQVLDDVGAWLDA